MTILDWGVVGLLSVFTIGATLRGLGVPSDTKQRDDEDEDRY